MKLYMVARFGNDDSPDGPDGDDTVFLVRAPDEQFAADIVDELLKYLPHEKVAGYAQHIQLVGTDLSLNDGPGILMGPVYKPCYLPGYHPCWFRLSDKHEWQKGRLFDEDEELGDEEAIELEPEPDAE